MQTGACRLFKLIVAPLALAFMAPSTAGALVFSVGGSTPDHSQHSDIIWQNYCGPTTASDWVYYFANTYPSLRQGNPLPPAPGADPGADAIIGELATRMGTTFQNGTSASPRVSRSTWSFTTVARRSAGLPAFISSRARSRSARRS